MKGLPEHLARFTKGIPKRTPKPPGQRKIALRLAPKPVPAKSTSASRQRRLTSTPRKTPPSAATEEVITVEPTPAVDQDLRSKINARSKDSEPMEEETHNAEDQLKEPEPTLVPIDCSKEKPVLQAHRQQDRVGQEEGVHQEDDNCLRQGAPTQLRHQGVGPASCRT